MEDIAAITREFVQDKEKFRELSDIAIALAEYEAIQTFPNDNRAKAMKLGLEILSYQNSDAVFSCAQSPIETTFLNTLALCFIKNSMFLHMVTDVPNAMQYTSELRKQLSQFRLLANWYKEHCGNSDEILEHLKAEVRAGTMSQDHRRFLVRWFLTYEWLDLGREFHLVLQAGFPHIKIDGSSIRTDLFFFIPDKDKVNLIVKCDGWQWHGNRDSFVRDKKRDRALQDLNFHVRRYSGSEIHNDPVGAANDLFKHLIKHRQT